MKIYIQPKIIIDSKICEVKDGLNVEEKFKDLYKTKFLVEISVEISAAASMIQVIFAVKWEGFDTTYGIPECVFGIIFTISYLHKATTLPLRMCVRLPHLNL